MDLKNAKIYSNSVSSSKGGLIDGFLQSQFHYYLKLINKIGQMQISYL